MAAIKRARVSSLLTGDAVISKKEIFTIVFGEELCVFFLFTFLNVLLHFYYYRAFKEKNSFFSVRRKYL